MLAPPPPGEILDPPLISHNMIVWREVSFGFQWPEACDGLEQCLIVEKSRNRISAPRKQIQSGLLLVAHGFKGSFCPKFWELSPREMKKEQSK